jgi:hypothetical protein
MKQMKDRQRMLQSGEISEDEPTYYAQGRGMGQGQRRGRRQQQQQQYESDEDQDDEGKGYDDSPGHKMTPQERVSS